MRGLASAGPAKGFARFSAKGLSLVQSNAFPPNHGSGCAAVRSAAVAGAIHTFGTDPLPPGAWVTPMPYCSRGIIDGFGCVSFLD
jgi:hypothetical protein